MMQESADDKACMLRTPSSIISSIRSSVADDFKAGLSFEASSLVDIVL